MTCNYLILLRSLTFRVFKKESKRKIVISIINRITNWKNKEFPRLTKNDNSSFYILSLCRSTFGENSDGPHIVVICEYDALPLIGHACGHNLIAEVGLASGIGIRAALGNSEKPLGKVIRLMIPSL
jgi:hypothetical protein